MFRELVFDAVAAVYSGIDYLRSDILYLITRTIHLPTHLITQLRTPKHKLINQSPTHNPQPIPYNMNPVYPITSNIRIKIKYNLTIISTSSNMHPICKEKQIITNSYT